MFNSNGSLRWSLFLVICGTSTYFTLYMLYSVRWRCVFNEYECVVYDDNDSTDVHSDTLVLRKNSSCSQRATDRGPNQKVVSYSFYGSDKNPRRYFQGIETNAVLVAKHYPSWVVRIYSNSTMLPVIEQLQEKYSFIDFCFVDAIEGHGNLGEKFGMLWRFLPMGDPFVDIFVSRDLDSVITRRELAAVQEWLDSNKTFHIMRDHPQHSTEILGGMWGARVSGKRHLCLDMLVRMLKHGDRKNFTTYLDQVLLRKFVWPRTQGDCILHDSYLCKFSYLRHEIWRPWPTRRENFQFVGASEPDEVVKMLCPESCRKHKNWTYC